MGSLSSQVVCVIGLREPGCMRGCWGAKVQEYWGAGVQGVCLPPDWRKELASTSLLNAQETGPTLAVEDCGPFSPSHQAQACSFHSASLLAPAPIFHPQSTPGPHLEESGCKAAAWWTRRWSQLCRSRDNQRHASELQEWEVRVQIRRLHLLSVVIAKYQRPSDSQGTRV